MVTTVPTGPEAGEKPLILGCTIVGVGVGEGVGAGAGAGVAELPHSFLSRFILSERTCRLLSKIPPVSWLFGV
jgi:hypothetical protein